MSTRILTKAQKLEMQAVGREALAQLSKHEPTFASTMAGGTFSGQIWTVLDTLFEDLQKVGQRLPNEFSPSAVDADLLGEVDSTASTYLATDLFRPTGGWSWSAKKRALNREVQDMMDQRAMMAFLYLKQAHTYRDYYQSFKKPEKS